MTIHNTSFDEVKCSSIKDVDHILASMPAPKAKKKKKKKKAADDDDGGDGATVDGTSEGGKKKKKKKKKKAKASDIPEWPALMRGPEQTCE